MPHGRVARRHAVALIVLCCAILGFAAPAQARIDNIFPSLGGDAYQPAENFWPTDTLYASITADQGVSASICIVKAEVEYADDLTCDKAAWGGVTIFGRGFTNGIQQVQVQPASGWWHFGPSYLRAGDYKLLAENDGDFPKLSDPFHVFPCDKTLCPGVSYGQLHQQWKDSALAHAKAEEKLCLSSRHQAFSHARGVSIAQLRATFDSTAKEMIVSKNPDGTLHFEFDEEIYQHRLAILYGDIANIECRIAAIDYKMAADPPDPDYAHVAQPHVELPMPTSDDDVNAAGEHIAAAIANGEAALHAYERFQGADAADDEPGRHRQSAAIARFTDAMVHGLTHGADAIDRIATRLESDPEDAGSGLTQDQLDSIAPILQRLRTSGFTAGELTELHATGADDLQVADLRGQLTSFDLANAPLGQRWSAGLHEGAADMRDTQTLDAWATTALAVDNATNTAPVAAFAVPINTYKPGEAVPFDASDSSDDAGVASYAWDFGDGQVGAGRTPSHPYAAGGDYTVTLTVTDDEGLTGTQSQVVHIPIAAPVNTASPAITGTARDRETLSSTTGTWTQPVNDPVALQWQRCAADGTSCDAIANETGADHIVTPADVGHRLRTEATAFNDGGQTVAHSAPTGVVAAVAVTTVTAPSVTGNPRAGSTLIGDDGAYDGTPDITVTRQWLRCDGAGAACQAIAGATGHQLDLTDADVDSRIRLRVTAANAAGPLVVQTDPTEDVAGSIPPVNTAAPAITGTTRDGELLHADPGTWNRDPLGFSFQWERCDAAGAGCDAITGATNQDYAATADDVGHRLRVRVHAEDADGAANAASPPTAAIGAAPPVAGNPPVISGTPQDGHVLTATPDTFTGTPPVVLGYRWRRCDDQGAQCADIAGATGPAYGLEVADIGHTVRVVVTGTNSGGEAPSTSDPTATITAFPSSYVPHPGYAVTDFVKGFGDPNPDGVGPIGIAFAPNGDLYVSDYNGGHIYKFGPGGGTAGPAHLVADLGGQLAGMAFDKDGRLYAGFGGIVEIDLDHPATPVKRRLTSGGVLSVAVDPLSGDVFYSGGPCGICRIKDPAGAAPVLTAYSARGGDGITFGPDGTLFIGDGSAVWALSSTASGPVSERFIAAVSTVDGVAVGNSADPTVPPFVIANRNDHTITRVDMPAGAEPVLTDIVTGASRGDFIAVGPDGCLYATQSASVAKISYADGSCDLAPTTADNEPPTTVATRSLPANAHGWNKLPVGVTLTATDGLHGAGVDHVVVAGDGGQAFAAQSSDGDVAHVLVSKDGETTLHFHAVDKSGNVEEDRTIVVRVDRKAPVATLASPAAGGLIDQGADAVAGFACTDTGGSDIAACTGDVADGAPLDTSTLGPRTFHLTAEDRAGNTTTLTKTYTIVDRAAPATVATRSIEPNAAGWAGGPVTVTLSAVDTVPAARAAAHAGRAHRVGRAAAATGSGVASIVYSLSGAQTGGATATGATATVPVTGAGTTTVAYHAVDAAGNAEAERTLTVRIDPTAPTVAITRPAQDEHVAQDADLRAGAACADEADGSGLASCAGSAADGSALDTRTPGAHTVTLTATDKAGNSATVERRYVVDEKPAPVQPASKPATPVAATGAPIAATEVFTLPSTKSCVSRRKFVIRLRSPKGTKLTGAKVSVDDKPVKTISGRRLTAPVNLTGLPKGRFTVKVTATTADGRTVSDTRKYRTCAPKKR